MVNLRTAGQCHSPGQSVQQPTVPAPHLMEDMVRIGLTLGECVGLQPTRRCTHVGQSEESSTLHSAPHTCVSTNPTAYLAFKHRLTITQLQISVTEAHYNSLSLNKQQEGSSKLETLLFCSSSTTRFLCNSKEL